MHTRSRTRTQSGRSRSISNGMSCVITNATGRAYSRVPFSVIKDAVIGTRYDLSIVFVTPAKIRALNKKYRHKNDSTDVLSFPLNRSSGELYFSMPDVKKKAPLFDMSSREYLTYLTVHGLLHLKGHDHGQVMTRMEKRYEKRFGYQLSQA